MSMSTPASRKATAQEIMRQTEEDVMKLSKTNLESGAVAETLGAVMAATYTLALMIAEMNEEGGDD